MGKATAKGGCVLNFAKPRYDHPSISHAIKMLRCLDTENYTRFFRLLPGQSNTRVPPRFSLPEGSPPESASDALHQPTEVQFTPEWKAMKKVSTSRTLNRKQD